MILVRFTASLFVLFFATGSAMAQDFNMYILKSVEDLYVNHAGGGFDLSAAFTHDLPYGNAGTIKAKSPTKTMCVAAVTEVILNALIIYSKENIDQSIFDKIPLKSWTTGTPLSLRANLFMYGGTGSRGTAHTLARFGLGEELAFQDLAPGDFVNFNRTWPSGHGVVFIGYLDKNQKVSATYGPDVVGFRYFSAQGKGKPDAGLGYRNAFFDGYCPHSVGTPVDCKVIRSKNPVLLNVGRMWAPDRWNFKKALEQQTTATRSLIEDQNPDARGGLIDQLLEQELSRELSWSADQAQAFSDEGPEAP